MEQIRPRWSMVQKQLSRARRESLILEATALAQGLDIMRILPWDSPPAEPHTARTWRFTAPSAKRPHDQQSVPQTIG